MRTVLLGISGACALIALPLYIAIYFHQDAPPPPRGGKGRRVP